MSYCLNPNPSNRENSDSEKDCQVCETQRLIYCINPDCSQRENLDHAQDCQACGTQLKINNRYQLVRPLRSLKNRHHTEVFEVDDGETPKVLKILQADEESLKLVELFEQEAKVLRYLKHPGIPKAELGEYFTFLPKNGQMLRCLVMEKIPGQDLERWVKDNGPISEAQAFDWLRQIIEILALVHQKQFFHRDIKPSNIMRRSDGQLVLIDFGTARELSQTVIDGRTVTVVYSHGYTAPEQLEGKAVPQSDFFALGRTFVYLLTSKQPSDLDKVSPQEQLIWRDHAPQVSKQFADLIDHLMARSPKERPQEAKTILQRLDKIKPLVKPPGLAQPRKKWWAAGLISGVAVVVGLIYFWPREPREPLCFTDVPNIPNGIFNYGGSTTWAPIRKLADPVIQKALPEFILRYESPTSVEGTAGSITGIQMLLAGQLTIVQSSRFLENENQQQAQQRGVSLIQKPVALDAIAVAVNPELHVHGLTLDQLKDIYTGKIFNWQQVGGPNLAIIPYSRILKDSGTVRWFKYIVLNNQNFGKNVRFVSETTQGLGQVATKLGGIYYASAPEVIPQCGTQPLLLGREPGQLVSPYKEPYVPKESCPKKKNQVNQEAFKHGQYPLTRSLYVIYKQFTGSKNIEEKAGEAYVNLLLTPQGQSLIEKAGFVPIRDSDIHQVCPVP